MDFLIKYGNQYLCWHPYKARWYLGKKRNAEWFAADFRNPGYYTPRVLKAVEEFGLSECVRVWRRGDA